MIGQQEIPTWMVKAKLDASVGVYSRLVLLSKTVIMREKNTIALIATKSILQWLHYLQELSNWVVKTQASSRYRAI
jgi:hypothetical protein